MKMMMVLLIAAAAQDYPGDMPLSRVLIDGEGWQLVAEGFQFTEGPAVDREGNVFLSDIPASRIHKIDASGKVTLFAENTADQTLIAAAIAITASPLILLYIFTQRYIIAGMTSGALKG